MSFALPSFAGFITAPPTWRGRQNNYRIIHPQFKLCAVQSLPMPDTQRLSKADREKTSLQLAKVILGALDSSVVALDAASERTSRQELVAAAAYRFLCQSLEEQKAGLHSFRQALVGELEHPVTNVVPIRAGRPRKQA